MRYGRRFGGNMESRRPGGNDVNDTAAETAALHSGKTWASSLRSGRHGARPSHSSLQPLVAYFSASQLLRFSAGGFAAGHYFAKRSYRRSSDWTITMGWEYGGCDVLLTEDGF
ncbi:MAG: hypothetical protein IKR48_05920 [Kiritimatiellae bacterium]|nr:hypothetical protein [Kiritimatiellia bacterium]